MLLTQCMATQLEPSLNNSVFQHTWRELFFHAGTILYFKCMYLNPLSTCMDLCSYFISRMFLFEPPHAISIFPLHLDSLV